MTKCTPGRKTLFSLFSFGLDNQFAQAIEIEDTNMLSFPPYDTLVF